MKTSGLSEDQIIGFLSHLDSIPRCVATAPDDAQRLAMLIQRKGENLDALLQRLDAAICDAYENDRFIDEVNAVTPRHT